MRLKNAKDILILWYVFFFIFFLSILELDLPNFGWQFQMECEILSPKVEIYMYLIFIERKIFKIKKKPFKIEEDDGGSKHFVTRVEDFAPFFILF